MSHAAAPSSQKAVFQKLTFLHYSVMFIASAATPCHLDPAVSGMLLSVFSSAFHFHPLVTAALICTLHIFTSCAACTYRTLVHLWGFSQCWA